MIQYYIKLYFLLYIFILQARTPQMLGLSFTDLVQ